MLTWPPVVLLAEATWRHLCRPVASIQCNVRGITPPAAYPINDLSQMSHPFWLPALNSGGGVEVKLPTGSSDIECPASGKRSSRAETLMRPLNSRAQRLTSCRNFTSGEWTRHDTYKNLQIRCVQWLESESHTIWIIVG